MVLQKKRDRSPEKFREKALEENLSCKNWLQKCWWESVEMEREWKVVVGNEILKHTVDGGKNYNFKPQKL